MVYFRTINTLIEPKFHQRSILINLRTFISQKIKTTMMMLALDTPLFSRVCSEYFIILSQEANLNNLK